MKKLLALLSVLLCTSPVTPWSASLQAQNIEGQIIASQYGKWKVPGYAQNTYSNFAPDSCRVQGGASFFFAFNAGTPITILDANPSLNETVMPTATVNSNVACAVTIAPLNDHQLPFYLTSATGGLQEALNQNLTNPQTNTVILDNLFYQLVGGPTNAAAVIAAAKGNTSLGLMDVTQVPTVWYAWNGTQYVRVGNGGVGTGLNTLVNDLVSNNASNSGAQDLSDFVATGPAVYNPQAAVNAAATNNGSVILQPGVGRTPFSNTGNIRVQDNRTDVPATARGATEFGAVCDARNVYGTFASGSTAFLVTNGTLTNADIGKMIVAVGSLSGVPTSFASVLASVTDGQHGAVTTSFPFNQASPLQMDLGHDDTAAISQGMAAVGAGGTLVFPAGVCLTHKQTLTGQSPIGLGLNSKILGFPGEDIFAAPDPSQGSGGSQGAAHIHDLTFLLDARIDATLPWQVINDSGTRANAALYRPIAQKTGVSSNPVAPGWFQGSGPSLSGAYNGVAAITASSAVMCVPTSETAPAAGLKVVFPYLASVFTATVLSNAGSCSAGSTARTLSAALPAGSTNTQAEWFAGASPQNLATSIGSGACPSTITLTNSINPVPGFESNVAPFGLIQIDGEQFTYFGKSDAGNPSPANTLYGVQCAQNGTSRAAHASAATVVPLNNFKPSYPWPVTPTVNSGDTTPAGNAGYFPGWNVGNAAFAFPVATGISQSYAVGAWASNSKIENLSFSFWPADGNANWSEVNHTAMLYYAQPSYATTFSNLFDFGLFFGVAGGGPSIENANWGNQQPTQDGTHYDGVTIFAPVPVNVPYGNQNTYSNFNVYSEEQTITGTALGADTCYYFTTLFNDQTGGILEANSLDHFKNLYCEPEGGAHAGTMPNWEWDTFNSEMEAQHMGGGGEVYMGGGNQHWFGGNFNQSAGAPAINWGTGNTSDFVAGLGLEPRSNSYGAGSLINFAPGTKFSGITTDVYGTPTGPFGALQVGNNREPIASQTNETFNTGNTTAPYVSSGGGLITPEEFNANFSFESQAMSVGWTFDDTSPVTHAYAACNVGNNPGVFYCLTAKFNQSLIGVGPGQRIANGKYTMYVSLKDAATTSNTFTFSVGTTCNGAIGTYTIPITNTWPTTAAGVLTKQVDFTGVTSSGCGLLLYFQGATTADQVQVGYVDFAPVAEQLNVQTLTVTNMNVSGSLTGGTATGCIQSPVTGINGGYSCPTKGDATALTANQGTGDTTISVSSTSGFSPSGCFFVDGEYECYSSIPNGTTFAGLQRGAYTTTVTTHNSGAPLVAVSLVLGSIQQAPSTVIAYGTTEAPIVGINNATPYNHGGASVLSINSGGNETWLDSGGGLHQLNPSAGNLFQAPVTVGTSPLEPAITQSGLVLQTNGPNSAYYPMTLGGGHAGSLNVITTPTITAATLTNLAGSGSTTYSYVCAGTDFDGNLINGTTVSVTNGPASYGYPASIQIVCPYVAGVNTYQIYRTAGGPNQGLLASGTGPGFSIFDFYGSAAAGSPPSSNASNPHLSVTGSGTPTINLGTASITFAATAPSGSCISGSLWTNSGGSPNTLYVCQSSAWVGK